MKRKSPFLNLIKGVTLLAAGIFVCYFLGRNAAFAHDPKHPELDGWYGALKQPPEYRYGCCNHRDCLPTLVKSKQDENGRFHYQALYPQSLVEDSTHNTYIDVPDGKVIEEEHLPGGENFAEEGVLCAQPNQFNFPYITCFVRPVLRG